MGAPGTSGKVLDVLSKHRGIDVTVTDICQDTGLTREQVKTAVNNLAVRHNLPITTVVRGNVYRYEKANAATTPKSDETLYVQLGVTKAGVVLLEDEEGELWRATKIQ